MQLFLEPLRQGPAEAAQAARGIGEVGFEHALELAERFLVEGDVVKLSRLQAGFLQAVGDGLGRKAGVVLLAGKALFLRRRDEHAVTHQGSRTVVIKGRNAEDGSHLRLLRGWDFLFG